MYNAFYAELSIIFKFAQVGVRRHPSKRRVLVHSLNEIIDEFFSIASLATLHKMLSLLLDATTRCIQFEWPEEIVGFFEMITDGPDLVHQILHADDIILPQFLNRKSLVYNIIDHKCLHFR